MFYTCLWFCSQGGVSQHVMGTPQEDTPEADPQADTHLVGRYPLDRLPRQTPNWTNTPLPEMTTEEGSTHPTGMHFCLWIIIEPMTYAFCGFIIYFGFSGKLWKFRTN